MNNTDLPPLPKAGEHGPEVCTTVQLYLAVLDDLSAEQVRILFEHVSTCAGCAAELRLLTLATYLTGPADMTPPPQVDQTVRATIAALSSAHFPEYIHAIRSHRRLRNHRLLWLIGQVAAARLTPSMPKSLAHCDTFPMTGMTIGRLQLHRERLRSR